MCLGLVPSIREVLLGQQRQGRQRRRAAHRVAAKGRGVAAPRAMKSSYAFGCPSGADPDPAIARLGAPAASATANP